MRLFQYFSFLKKVNIIDFFYLNYFCESVIRTDHYKLIPYKNSVIDISKNAKIYIRGGDIEIGCDLLKKSKAETGFDYEKTQYGVRKMVVKFLMVQL